MNADEKRNHKKSDSRKRAFVFVVCGSREHIDTLHFSLHALKVFSNKEIFVVTDTGRNEIDIQHDQIIDIKTPEKFNHHQASIFLKTGLYSFLPSHYDYCYLDSDVIAVDYKVDKIFDQFVPPVTFAPDHYNIDGFSISAINCDCYEKFKERIDRYVKYQELYDNHYWPAYINILQEIDDLTQANKRNKLIHAYHWLRYHLADRRYYHLNHKYKLDKRTGQWLNEDDEVIDEKYGRFSFIQRNTGIQWDDDKKDFVLPDGSNPFYLHCTHLREALREQFNIHVEPDNWQHWNGGVFLFNEESHDFLHYWHHTTMSLFDDERWQTRDQGALIITTWKLGLQHHPTLDINYNFIVDYYNEDVQYLSDLQIQADNRIYKPHFLHIFFHFGDSNWPLWRDVEQKVLSAKREAHSFIS